MPSGLPQAPQTRLEAKQVWPAHSLWARPMTREKAEIADLFYARWLTGIEAQIKHLKKEMIDLQKRLDGESSMEQS